MKNVFISITAIVSILFSEMIMPENGHSLKSIHVLFEWNQEVDAVGYNFQISTNDSFNNLIVDINVSTTVYIEKDILDWDSDYYWRVRSVYIDNSFGVWIDESMFSINPSQLQDFDVSIYNDDLIQDGLIIFGQFAPDLLVGIIDKFGNEIWSNGLLDYDHGLGTLLNYVSKEGQLFGKASTAGIQFNYNQDILWESPDNIVIDLHEVQQLPNGNHMSWEVLG